MSGNVDNAVPGSAWEPESALIGPLAVGTPLEAPAINRLEEEFIRTRQMILRITGQRELLARNRVLARSIRLRNPYVDPMSLIQVELIRRKRTTAANGEPESPELNRAISATINGISAGLRNTG